MFFTIEAIHRRGKWASSITRYLNREDFLNQQREGFSKERKSKPSELEDFFPSKEEALIFAGKSLGDLIPKNYPIEEDSQEAEFSVTKA